MKDPTPPYLWRPVFLDCLAQVGSISQAARMAGISSQVVSYARNKDVEFDLQVQEAMQFAIERLEAVAWDRAIRHSDQLLIFLLKAHKPEVYNRPQRSELSGPDGGPVPVKAYVGFDPSVWDTTKPGEKVQTVDGDYVVMPEAQRQIGSSS